MFDPNAPFICQADGLEYADFGDCLIGRPVDCWRNKTILDWRAQGRSEEAIRIWIKGYDGEDPTPSSQLNHNHRVERQVRANFAFHPQGRSPNATEFL